MTVFNLLTFPNVCRACLQSVHPDQTIPVDTYRPLLEATVATFLQDISFEMPADLLPFIPDAVCIACLEVMEFFSKYRRKIKHLHEFLSALVRVKLGDEQPLRELFESRTEHLDVLFRDLDLCNITGAGVEDLLDEYDQYAIASMDTAAATQEAEEPMEEQYLIYCSEEESEATQSEPDEWSHRSKGLKIELDTGTAQNDSEVQKLTALADSGTGKQQKAPDSQADKSSSLLRKQFHCEQCPYKTIFTVAYTIHTKKHEQNEGRHGFVCNNPYCLQLFDTAQELKLHKKANPHKQYECEICGAELKHRISLEVHLERHVGITHFQCTYCTSSFHTKTEMQNHIAAIHISEDRAECEQCGAVFTSNKLLKQHIESHNTARNYQCVECKRSFKTQHQLNRHFKVHSDVRYQCEHCEVSYTRRDKLRMHVEKAHKIQTYFVCDICLRSFDNDEALQQHLQRHKFPNNLECGTCLLVSLTEESFAKHTCITYQENYICCGHDFKHHTVYNKHMMRHGIKVNARVKPNARGVLVGQERASKTTEEARSCAFVLPDQPENET
uniref:C2H2-type domain-containing protein n=1 Tax=Anopheles stephensi TaxID=30069 RepID=A0A182Y139_ANOST